MPGAKRNQSKKTGTLSWTEYCECEMLRQTEENDKLKHQHQLEMQELRRHHLEVAEDYERRLDELKDTSGLLARKKESVIWRRELEKVTKQNEDLKKELDELKEATCDYSYLSEQYTEHKRQIEECELVPSENVLCSYDDANEFIWGRLKDICRDEPNIPDFDWNDLCRDFKGLPELKKENAEQKQEIENLKTELKGDDARMDKIAEGYELQLRKKNAEIGVLKRKLAAASPSGWVED